MPEAQNHVWRWYGLGLNFTGITSLNSHNNNHLSLTEREMEAQRGQAGCLRSHSS